MNNLNTLLALFTENNEKEVDAFFVLKDILTYGKDNKLNFSNFKNILNSVRVGSSFHGPINKNDYTKALKQLLKSKEMLDTLYNARYEIKLECLNIIKSKSANTLKEYFKNKG